MKLWPDLTQNGQILKKSEIFDFRVLQKNFYESDTIETICIGTEMH